MALQSNLYTHTRTKGAKERERYKFHNEMNILSVGAQPLSTTNQKKKKTYDNDEM